MKSLLVPLELIKVFCEVGDVAPCYRACLPCWSSCFWHQLSKRKANIFFCGGFDADCVDTKVPTYDPVVLASTDTVWKRLCFAIFLRKALLCSLGGIQTQDCAQGPASWVLPACCVTLCLAKLFVFEIECHHGRPGLPCAHSLLLPPEGMTGIWHQDWRKF